jgi:L-histidine Nalpha-methyltransferase
VPVLAPSAPAPVASLHDTVEFRDAVLSGLARPRKEIPSKFFYDAEGSRLFERICELDEYYPTRTEITILRQSADRIATMLPPRPLLLEFGSGASVKVRLLLDALEQPAGYVPIDISGEHLLAAAEQLARDYPNVPILPVCADFTRRFRLPGALPEAVRVGFFPGSTIGNFHPRDAARILRGFATQLGSDGWLIIGVDLKKPLRLLHAAYNDEAGITAAFNLNLLARANRELGGTFDVESFRHRAIYNPEAGRIEMYLTSLCAQTVRVAGRRFRFYRGESIHTENSHKYSVEEFQLIATAAGYQPATVLIDPNRLFSVHVLRSTGM